jgi:hypothetical protein
VDVGVAGCRLDGASTAITRTQWRIMRTIVSLSGMDVNR